MLAEGVRVLLSDRNKRTVNVLSPLYIVEVHGRNRNTVTLTDSVVPIIIGIAIMESSTVEMESLFTTMESG